MSPASTAVRQIGLICVPTTDQDRAIEFYESIGLRSEPISRWAAGTAGWRCTRPAGSAGIALAPPPPGSDEVVPTQTGITLNTDDIDAAHAQFKSLGVDVDAEVSRMGDPVPPMFWFRDPTGHSLMVVEQP